MMWILVSQVVSPVLSDPWTTWGLLMLVPVLFILITLVFGRVKASASDVHRNLIELLDSQYAGYDPKKARSLYDAYGDSGREIYRARIVRFLDILFPISYGLLFVVTGVKASAHLFGTATLGWLLAALGLITMLLDLGENVAINVMLSCNPETYHDWERWASMGSVFTETKWAATAIATPLLLFNLVVSSFG